MRSPFALLALGCALLAAVLSAVPADGSRRVPLNGVEFPWVLDGGVEALAVAGGKLFVGGDFSHVAPPTGPIVAFMRAGKRDESFPAADLDAEVTVAIPDEQGGLYVGGSFKTLGGVTCRALAHIRRGGAVDRGFCPRPDGVVYTLALSGARLYVGGDFKRVAGVARENLAALDLSTGKATAFRLADPPLDVWQLAATPDSVYVLGARATFIALDPATGKVLPFNPDPDTDSHGSSVMGFALAGSRVYAWGYFGRIGGQPRNGIAAVDAVTGQALDWQPEIWPSAGVVSNGVLYLTGMFDHVDGEARAGLAAFAADSGRLLPWKPVRGLPESVGALSVGGGTIYVAGRMSEDSPTRVIVARSVRNGAKVRFAAPPHNGPIATIAVTPERVVVGGGFRSLGGTTQAGLLALDPASGQPLPWRAGMIPGNSFVKNLAVIGSTVYVAGFFGRAGGQKRTDFAAFDAHSGALLPWDPPLRWYLEGLAANSRGVYTAVGDVGRLGKLDLRSGAVRQTFAGFPEDIGTLAASDDLVFDAGWSGEDVEIVALEPNPLRLAARLSFAIRAEVVSQVLAADGRSVYVGGAYTHLRSVQQRYLARLRLERGTLRVDAWRPRVPGPVKALSVTGNDVVVAGITSDDSRWYVAVVDRTSGKARVVGYGGGSPGHMAVAASGRYVYVGAEFGLRRFRS